MRAVAGGLLRFTRGLQLRVWTLLGRRRMRWVGITLRVELGEGVVFVRQPFLLAGVGEPGSAGALTIRLGNRVRFAPGVIVEAEPGCESTLEIGDGTRIGANTHFHLRGGEVRISAGCEVRDNSVLKTSGGAIAIEDRCFVSYGCMLHATERVLVRERTVLAERVTLVDSGHETDGSDLHWALQDVPTAPVEDRAERGALCERGRHDGRIGGRELPGGRRSSGARRAPGRRAAGGRSGRRCEDA